MKSPEKIAEAIAILNRQVMRVHSSSRYSDQQRALLSGYVSALAWVLDSSIGTDSLQAILDGRMRFNPVRGVTRSEPIPTQEADDE
jgi:hypothetical protein